MPISTTDMETEPPLRSHHHRRRRRRRQSPEDSSATGGSASDPTDMPISTPEPDAPVRRRSKRQPPSTSPSAGSPAASYPSWLILGRAGARRDNFTGDDTTSAISHTSNGTEISVSFDLVEPPATSILTVDWPKGPSPSKWGPHVNVIAAHRKVVLFEISSASRSIVRPRPLADYFVYKASRCRRPSLSRRLPVLSYGENSQQHIMRRDDTGLLSCGAGKKKKKKKKGSPAFIVALLERSGRVLVEHDVHLFRSGSDKWVTFKKVHVHGANGGGDLLWWWTDAVVPYRSRFLIWVDYYRGMIVADMSPCLTKKKKAVSPPKLRYVRLPVEKVDTNPHSSDYGRGCPAAFRSICATRSGIKFVSVDHQEISSFGIGHMRTWTRTFRITTWSLVEEDNDYTWRKEATMEPEELWTVLDSSEHPLPHVPPEFPVVNVENPDVVCFQLDKSRYHACCFGEPAWMIEVDMKKKVLLACTVYPDNTSLAGDQASIKTAVRASQGFSVVSSEIPRYLCGGGKACKKRRQ